MADVFTMEKRSKVMAAIRSTGNRNTELRLIAIMRLYGIKGWRRKSKLPGKPDFVFQRERLAVFVDGCFWHGCRWHCRMPKSRTDFWEAKITRNKARDKEVRRLLAVRGWKICRIWEHALANPDKVADKLSSALLENSRRE